MVLIFSQNVMLLVIDINAIASSDNNFRSRFSVFVSFRFDMSHSWSVNRVRESTVVEVPMKALFAVFISLIEVYNNNIYDLLQEVSDSTGR